MNKYLGLIAVLLLLVSFGAAVFVTAPSIHAEMASYTTATYPFFSSSIPPDEVQYLYPPVNGSLLEVFRPPSVIFNGTVMTLSLTSLETECLRFNDSCGTLPIYIGNVTVAQSSVQLHVGKTILPNETISLSLRFGKSVSPGTSLTLSVATFSTYNWCDSDNVCQVRLGAGKTLNFDLSPYV